MAGKKMENEDRTEPVTLKLVKDQWNLWLCRKQVTQYNIKTEGYSHCWELFLQVCYTHIKGSDKEILRALIWNEMK